MYQSQSDKERFCRLLSLYSNFSARWTPKGRMWQIVPCRIPKQHVWYWFLFSTKTFPEQFNWTACEWPEFAASFLKSVLSEYCKIWSGTLLSTVLWVLTTVLRNKTKRAKNWAQPGKQRGCHNFCRQGVLSLHRIITTKPFLIALTLIHKLQDIITFVLVVAILCCLNPFGNNCG